MSLLTGIAGASASTGAGSLAGGAGSLAGGAGSTGTAGTSGSVALGGVGASAGAGTGAGKGGGMIGGIIGSALGALGGIFGGVSASKAMRRVKSNLEDAKRRNQDWYDRRYNEDVTQRADAQRLLSMTEKRIRERNKAIAGTQAVMGGTDESVAMAKASNAGVLGDVVADIAVNAENRKDGIERAYQHNDANLTHQLNQLEAGKANAIKDATMGVANAASKLPI